MLHHLNASDGTCAVCGETLPAKRRRFCSRLCYQRAEAKRPARVYREDAEARRKQLARMCAYRHLRNRQPCELCGSIEHPHRHHPDHSKPLDVRWICRVCHARLHAQERRAA